MFQKSEIKYARRGQYSMCSMPEVRNLMDWSKDMSVHSQCFMEIRADHIRHAHFMEEGRKLGRSVEIEVSSISLTLVSVTDVRKNEPTSSIA